MTWTDLCACGHAAARHNASPPKPGPSRNCAGPCHWCTCTAWTKPTIAEESTR